MKSARMIINITMTVVLICLMAYSLIGQLTHEILGILMFCLFTIHHLLNRKWFQALTKGKYNLFRTVQTVLIFVLILTVLGSALSGIVLSKHLFMFLSIDKDTAIARMIHLVCAYLNYILISFHLGMNWNSMLSQMHINRLKQQMLKIPAYLFAGFGLYAFIKRGIIDYLFLNSQFVYFDTGEPLLYFFLDYIAIMGLYVFFGYYFAKFIRKI